MMDRYADLKEIAWRCNSELPRQGLVIHTFGNASACDRSRHVFAIKPSGIPFDELSAENMVVVDLNGLVVQGMLRPSSDTRTHALLYREWPEVRGIVHTHSPYAVAWAQAIKPIPVLGTTHADLLPEDVPCTEVMTDEMIAGDYEEQTGHQILKIFAGRSYQEVEMAIVACHGPFAWGKTAEKAVENAVMLELIARLALMTLQIDPQTPRLKEALLKKHFERKHGPSAYYGQH
jgi:L-ribulose-5-phosphate 4-epimerase